MVASHRRQRKTKQPVRSIRLNMRMGLLAFCAVVAAVPLLFLGWSYREQQMTRAALQTARTLRDQGDTELAVRHLNQHLALRPGDADTLELKAEILAADAHTYPQYLEAARVHGQFLRVEPNSKRSQAIRRRLVRLYIKFDDTIRSLAQTTLENQIVALESRYGSAELVARQLLERGATDAEAHLLLALALDGRAVPGAPDKLEGAVEEYRKVLAMEPFNIEAAERLSNLYKNKLDDPFRAEVVLDDLLRALPRSVDVRLVRYRFFIGLLGHKKFTQDRANPDRMATAELAEAVKIAPGNIDVLVAAAQDALRRGDTASARVFLAKAPPASASDLRLLYTQGMIDYSDENPDEAIDAWRRGLSNSEGTNDQMTWWLAYALIQMGRTAKAVPLVEQYRRLTGEDTPLLRLLAAQIDERNGRPARAVNLLDQIRKGLTSRWEGLIQVSRGRCYEALWDDGRAKNAYRQALVAEPAAVVPRLAIARIELKEHPEDAIEVLRIGQTFNPDDPALRLAMAGALLRREALRPASSRDWRAFDAVWQRAAVASPNSSGVALLHADRLAVEGHVDEALAYLEQVAAQSPRSTTIAVALADGLNRLGHPDRALKVVDRTLEAFKASEHSPETSTGIGQAPLWIARARALIALNRGREARAGLTNHVAALSRSEQLANPARTGQVDLVPVSHETRADDLAAIWIEVGRTEMLRGNTEAARTAYLEWSRLQPADPRPHLILLDLAIEKDDESSIHTQVSLLREQATPSHEIGNTSYEPDDIPWRLARAKELMWQRGRAHPPKGSRDATLESAARLVDAVLNDAPELPAAHMLRAHVLEEQGQERTDEAINEYEISWGKGIEAALPRLVELYTQRRRFDSLARIRNTVSASRDAAQIALLSAQASARAGDRIQAARIADQVARDLPSSVEVASWQARMLNHLGQVEDAEAVYRALAERQPHTLQPWLDLIGYQASCKRTAALAETFKRVRAEVKIDPPELLEARLQWVAGESAAAEQAFAAALAKKPADTVVRVEAARFYEEQKRPREAETLLRALLQAEPKNRPIVRQLAAVLAGRAAMTSDPKAWDEAIALIDAPGPDALTPEDRLARAVVLARCPDRKTQGEVDAKRKSEAITALEELIADIPVRHPTAAQARKFLGELYTEAKLVDKAADVAAISATLAGDPASIALYAQTLLQSKKLEAAEWQIERLATLSPGNPVESKLRARLYYDRTRPVERAAALERAYSDREDMPGALALGREAFLLLAEIGPESNNSTERLGRRLAAKNRALSWMPALALVRSSRYAEALELLGTAVRTPGIGIEDLRATCRVAMQVSVATDDSLTLRQVDAILTAALAIEPNADEILVMRAMLSHVLARYDEEVRLYKGVLKHHPDSFVVLNNLAWALSEGLGQPREALDYVNSLIRSSESDTLTSEARERDTQARDTRGMVSSRLGDHLNAIIDLEIVVKNEPTALHHFHLARVYDRAANRKNDARRSFDLAMQAGLDPRKVDPTERGEYQRLYDLYRATQETSSAAEKSAGSTPK